MRVAGGVFRDERDEIEGKGVIFYASVPKSVSFVCNCESSKVTGL